ncbi:hypothetical protein K439DRAFT_1628115 [Ramaria rubella]|nr:hypothetical protein K439DRAFT_1628115 [Ramaria rubella]
MTKSYRVFTGAPSATLNRRCTAVSWQTVSSRVSPPSLSRKTTEQAEQQLSLIYRNAIVDEDGAEQEEELSEEWDSRNAMEWPPTNPSGRSIQSRQSTVNEISCFQQTYDTNQTGDETSMFSEGSSIGRFPTFSFDINILSSLSYIIQTRKPGNSSAKITLLLGVLEVDGPSYVTVKTGAQAGSEIGLLKLIVGDENSAVCKLVAWRETAEVWGGAESEPGLKRGDIVLFENVLISRIPSLPEKNARLQITASPGLNSQAQICYRTLPYSHTDTKLRSDLRLAASVACVRKVEELVTWMERMAGIAMKP